MGYREMIDVKITEIDISDKLVFCKCGKPTYHVNTETISGGKKHLLDLYDFIGVCDKCKIYFKIYECDFCYKVYKVCWCDE